jgi:hypothetical protein
MKSKIKESQTSLCSDCTLKQKYETKETALLKLIQDFEPQLKDKAGISWGAEFYRDVRKIVLDNKIFEKKLKPCKKCGGTGQIRSPFPLKISQINGYISCERCNGRGMIEE